jgi:hypothetical protein
MNLPIPRNCDNCCSININLVTNKHFTKIYICNDCGASTGCHPNTETPLGKMADLETRKLRVKAHNAFDPLWKAGYMTRTKAYMWLAKELQISFFECLMAWLNKQQLQLAIETCSSYLNLNRKALSRRKAKQNVKQYKRDNKTARRIHQRKAGY